MLIVDPSVEPPSPQPLAGRRILIVEDEALIGMAMLQSVQDAGGDALWVQTDRAAYAALRGIGRSFDTIILDINLGEGTTGFDVARHARTVAPGVRIIFSSGSPASWVDDFGVPDALFLAKPCTEAGLLVALARVQEPAGAQAWTGQSTAWRAATNAASE